MGSHLDSGTFSPDQGAALLLRLGRATDDWLKAGFGDRLQGTAMVGFDNVVAC